MQKRGTGGAKGPRYTVTFTPEPTQDSVLHASMLVINIILLLYFYLIICYILVCLLFLYSKSTTSGYCARGGEQRR